MAGKGNMPAILLALGGKPKPEGDEPVDKERGEYDDAKYKSLFSKAFPDAEASPEQLDAFHELVMHCVDMESGE